MKRDLRRVLALVQERRSSTLERIEANGFVYNHTNGDGTETYYNEKVNLVYDRKTDSVNFVTLGGRR